MVTAYTCRIADGRVTKLSDFALHCAENFIGPDWQGGLLDEDLEYYTERLEAAKKAILSWESMNNDERWLQYQEDLKDSRRIENEGNAERKRLLDRYKAIEFQLNDWNPPKILENLKSLMKQQVKASIEFDCAEVDRNYPIFDEWRQLRELRLNNDLSLAESSYAKAQIRIQKQNEFIRAIYESFGMEVPQE